MGGGRLYQAKILGGGYVSLGLGLGGYTGHGRLRARFRYVYCVISVFEKHTIEPQLSSSLLTSLLCYPNFSYISQDLGKLFKLTASILLYIQTLRLFDSERNVYLPNCLK